MEKNKPIKVTLGTTICIFIIIILIILLGTVYYFGFVEDSKKIKNIESEKEILSVKNNQLVEKLNELQEENNVNYTIEEKTDPNFGIKKSIENYILTQFGPKNNMSNVNVIAYEELTIEDYFSKTPGQPLSKEEIEQYKKENPNLLYGYCVYYIELNDITNISMEGSKPELQKTVGNTIITEAAFTYDKTEDKINFAVSYGFSNVN